ncbi:Protein CBFA2T1 [Characodon lateralis]|uniref:Protein CBFA2T1 n=1 Tax=Characodon lateralis TaxID=208331 RepID=A0ABU7D0X4_9TELE|nr:Protein CBFA2T1 [Characodon lateralis]
MVEKTRRSLTVLRRCQEADREELNYWIRRYSDAEELKKGASSGQSRQQSPTAQENATSEIHRELLHRPVSGYVPEEIWKKAGEQHFHPSDHHLCITHYPLQDLWTGQNQGCLFSILMPSGLK